MSKLKYGLLQMINQYRHNNRNFRKSTTIVKDYAVHSQLQKELLIDEDDLKFKKDTSPRKRVVQKLTKQVTEYER